MSFESTTAAGDSSGGPKLRSFSLNKQFTLKAFGVNMSEDSSNPPNPDFLLLSNFKNRVDTSCPRKVSNRVLKGTEAQYFKELADLVGSPNVDEIKPKDRINYEDLSSIRERFRLKQSPANRSKRLHSESSLSNKIEANTWRLLDLMLNRVPAADVVDFIETRKQEKLDLHRQFAHGRSLLIYSIMVSNPAYVSLLLGKSKNLASMADDKGLSPLHYAVLGKSPEIVGILLNFGVDPECLDNQFRTPLHWAAIKNYSDIYLQLKARGGSGKSVDRYGLKPLHYITDKRMLEAVLLLEQGMFKQRSVKSFIESVCTQSSGDLLPQLAGPAEIASLVEKDKTRHFVNRRLTYFNRLNIRCTKEQPEITAKDYYRDFYREHLDCCYSLKDEHRRKRSPGRLIKNSIKEIEQESADEEEQDTMSQDSDDSSGIEIPSQHVISHKDFIIHDRIGKGSFGEILVVSLKGTDQKYAIKSLPKKAVSKGNMLRLVTSEKKVMANFIHPFMVGLHHSFQTEAKLFMVMDYCEKQDLGKFIRNQGTLTELQVKILAAEMVLAIKALHSKNFIHRDIKVDNIFISKDGHIKLGDFGLTKELSNSSPVSQSFCGSIAYLPPEIVSRGYHGKPVDWYLLGEVMYEVLLGKPPFYAESKLEIQENILFKEISMPLFVSKNLRDIIAKLLVRDPEARLGSKLGSTEVMEHPFFEGLDWNKVYEKKYALFDPDEIKSYQLRNAMLNIPNIKASSEKPFTMPFWNYSRPYLSPSQ